ncbi:MAG: alpha-(1-_3)-arabinofuranosyltransferase domain-containing protein [Blastococcus sp.]
MTTVLTRGGGERTGAVPSSPPRSNGSPASTPAADPRARARLLRCVRSGAVCLAFVGLTLSQQPGRTLPDTKLDLVVDPWGFLGRAVRMWEPQGFAGQVQDQAYGYLFPMGPFFALGHTATIPSWVLQRLWMALLLSVAFLGVMALSRRLRIGSPATRLIGALAYALAPRMISGLDATSVELLPMALAPWVLIPLVVGARSGSPRRAAALSGLAVFCVGGVNAVATAAVLPLPALWLLTRAPGPRRRRLMGWWTVSVALATAWWAGPLLLLGRYSPPFLDYIENAGTTTGQTGLLAVLRGTSQWVAYLADLSGPLWPGGWALVHDALPIAGTVLLATAGLVGLTRRDLPDRAWLVLGLFAGLFLVTLGHLGDVQGLLAAPAHAALDGVLAPMRNVHKFDPVLRLPLALGVAHLGKVLAGWAGRVPRTRWVHAVRLAGRGGLALLVLALIAASAPAVEGRLAAPTGFSAIPGYWRQTADWLAGARASGRALLVPASSFGTYAWGSTGDEPMQPLARSPWEVRNAVPLTPPAHIRMLDAIEQRLVRGEGSPGLSRYLARAGISYLVVRNDLDAGTAGVARSILVHRALDDSPGLALAAGFGPLVPGATSIGNRVLDAFLTAPRSAVEIYTVADPVPLAYTTPLADAVSVVGGPDAILGLEDRGLLTGRPALLPDGSTPLPGTAMVSDAQVRRERTFGRIDGATSAGLTAGDPLRLGAAARDYEYPGAALGESVVAVEGGSVSASGSASDADSLGGAQPADQPYAALDGDPTTAWRPPVQAGGSAGAWWRLDLDHPVDIAAITVRLPAGADPAPVLRVRTDGGSRTVALRATTDPQPIALPAGPTRSLTIGAAGGGPLALAEVVVPGVPISRTVVTPAPGVPATAYAFDAAGPAASGCVREPTGRPRCSPALVHAAEEPGGIDRVFTVAGAARFSLAATVVPRPGAALDALIARAARPRGPEVSASSATVPDPRASADAAVDGNPATAWIADSADPDPSLTLHWGTRRTIDSIRIVLTPGTAASAPLTIGVSDGGIVRPVRLDATGTARFAPIVTDTLVLSFPLVGRLSSYDPYTRSDTPLGVGVSEVEASGLSASKAGTVVDVPCGEGPVVRLDGRSYATSLRTTLDALRSLQPVSVRLCGTASLPPLGVGVHRLAVASTDAFGASAATLASTTGPAGTDGVRTAGRLLSWGAEDRQVAVAGRAAPALLVVPENVNDGWTATLDGSPLQRRTVDGWQQGYVLPAGAAGVVHLVFTPGTAYRAALGGGAAAVVLLLLLTLLPARGTSPAPSGRRAARAAVALVLFAGLGLLGGPAGLVAGVAAAAVGRVAHRAREGVLAAIAGGAVVAAGVVLLAAGPASEPATQALVLTALAATAASLFGNSRRRSGTRPRHRLSGRSRPK